jgi:hypothetical protein
MRPTADNNSSEPRTSASSRELDMSMPGLAQRDEPFQRRNSRNERVFERFGSNVFLYFV